MGAQNRCTSQGCEGLRTVTLCVDGGAGRLADWSSQGAGPSDMAVDMADMA
jgi:hypothetical protein